MVSIFIIKLCFQYSTKEVNHKHSPENLTIEDWNKHIHLRKRSIVFFKTCL